VLDNKLALYYNASVIAQISHLHGKAVIIMFEIDSRSRIPIYEQIKNQMIMCIRLGIYKPDEQLPSIRVVSQQTKIDVNTVKRAFAELEEEGIIYSLAGRGSFVSADAAENTSIAEKALKEIEIDIRSMKSKGVKKEDIISLIEKIYTEEKSND
jgi:GntR family transcriptional regulator